MINFKVTPLEQALITNIVERATALAEEIDLDIVRLDLEMDLTACHANGCRLRLLELLNADEWNFWHDIVGIYRHMDRTTGQLTDCFLPRFAE